MRKLYISKEKLERVYSIIEELQADLPDVPVTLEKVKSKINEKRVRNPMSIQPQITYKTIQRAFSKLCEKEDKKSRLTRKDRGQYWIPEVYENQLEVQKRLKEEILAGAIRVTGPYFDAIKYITDEEWEVIWAIIRKRKIEKRDKNYEREMIEAYEAEQEQRVEIMEQLKKEKEK